MDVILNEAPGVSAVLEQILLDLGIPAGQRGREGMSAEQVLRAGIIRMRLEMRYRDLEHATQDSLSIREFLKIGYGKGLPNNHPGCAD